MTRGVIFLWGNCTIAKLGTKSFFSQRKKLSCQLLWESLTVCVNAYVCLWAVRGGEWERWKRGRERGHVRLFTQERKRERESQRVCVHKWVFLKGGCLKSSSVGGCYYESVFMFVWLYIDVCVSSCMWVCVWGRERDRRCVTEKNVNTLASGWVKDDGCSFSFHRTIFCIWVFVTTARKVLCSFLPRDWKFVLKIFHTFKTCTKGSSGLRILKIAEWDHELTKPKY